jgi:hypothetical protein
MPIDAKLRTRSTAAQKPAPSAATRVEIEVGNRNPH